MIYLVRHGQTDWNLFRRCNGVTDTFLNRTGIEQAKQQADILKNVSFGACFCSPLTRARQHCEILNAGAAVFDDRLSEICCGEFEGRKETLLMWLRFLHAVKTGAKGTERFDAFMERNCDLCDEIAEKHRGKNVLIITHSANARVINYYFSGKPENYDFKKAVARNNAILTFEN
jgi:probable phosphoglycerate mutase